ncbi:hypothetical protein BDV06DRAFT_116800 [Aspergillus oleicola]
MPDTKGKGKAKAQERSYKPMSYILLPPSSTSSTPPKPQSPARTIYAIYIGWREATKTLDDHWAVIVQSPVKYPGEGDCTWYHCISTDWAETDHYRRVISEYRYINNQFFDRKWRVGLMREGQMRNFQNAFKMTPPQPNEFFFSRFLRHLVEQGVLGSDVVVNFERVIGPCPDPERLKFDFEYQEPPYTPGGGPLIFPMEL